MGGPAYNVCVLRCNEIRMLHEDSGAWGHANKFWLRNSTFRQMLSRTQLCYFLPWCVTWQHSQYVYVEKNVCFSSSWTYEWKTFKTNYPWQQPMGAFVLVLGNRSEVILTVTSEAEWLTQLNVCGLYLCAQCAADRLFVWWEGCLGGAWGLSSSAVSSEEDYAELLAFVTGNPYRGRYLEIHIGRLHQKQG